MSESDVAAIRAAFQKGGELSAALELRQRFVGISSNAEARRSVQVILRWTPPPQPSPLAERKVGEAAEGAA